MSTSRPEDALIDRWLDEGDQLSESAREIEASTIGPKRRRLNEALAALRTIADRRRPTVVIGVVVAAAIVVGTMRAVAHAVLETGHAVATHTPGKPAPPLPMSAPAPVPAPAPAPSRAPAVVAPAAAAADPLPAAAAPAVDPMPVDRVPVATRREPLAFPTALPEAAVKPVAASGGGALKQCQTELRRERAKHALAVCEKAANDNPTSADAQVSLAHANLLAGRDRETLRLARLASALDPKCGDAYLLIGTVLHSSGRLVEARLAYESYLRTAPNGSFAAEIRAILKTL